MDVRRVRPIFPSPLPSRLNLCERDVVELDGGPSVQSGRKSENLGVARWFGSEEGYSCNHPAGVRTKYASLYVRVQRFLRSRCPVCTANTLWSVFDGYSIVSWLRSGVSGSSRWSVRAANSIHSRSGAREDMEILSARQVSCTASLIRVCHSSNVCQVD